MREPFAPNLAQTRGRQVRLVRLVKRCLSNCQDDKHCLT
jgi:hypothetical protein